MSKTIHLALDLLETMADGGAPARLTELATALDQAKPTIHRALAALEERGYVVQLPDERYRLGVRCLELGSSSAEVLDVRAVARPHIEALSQETDENVHLAIYDRGDVVYVDKVDSAQPVAPRSRVGTRAPATAVATGRATLAFQTQAEVERVLARPLPQYTPRSITDPDEMMELLEQIRVTGVAINQSSWREGVCGLAAPVRDHTGVVVASVGCCMPEVRFPESRRPELAAAVLGAAAEISRQLGHQSSTTGRAS